MVEVQDRRNAEDEALAPAPEGVVTFVWSAGQVAAVMVAGLVLVVVAHLWATHDKAIRDADVLASALANSLEQTIGGSLRSVDSLLDEVLAAIEVGGHESAKFSADLLDRLPSFPELRYIGTVDADGIMRRETWPAIGVPADGFNATDRHYFRAQKGAAGAPRAMVGEPVVGHGTRERTVHLSRPLHDAKGDFAGVAVAAINPDVYAEILRSIRVGEAGVCTVLSLEGRIIARAPAHPDRFASVIGNPDLTRVHAANADIGVAHLSMDGVEMVIGYRVLADYGLMVAYGVPRAKALADWYRMVALEVLLALAFSVAMLLWAHQIDRRRAQWRQHDRDLDRAVAERTEQLARARMLAERNGDRLASLNQELKRLATVAAHHLQEPIRTVVSFAQLADRHLRDIEADTVTLLRKISIDGLALKTVLGKFQQHVFALENVSDITPEDCGTMVRQVAARLREIYPDTMPLVVVRPLPSLSLPSGVVQGIFTDVLELAARTAVSGHPATLTVSAQLYQNGWLFRITDECSPARRAAEGERADAPPAGVAAAMLDHPDAAPCRAVVESLGGRLWTDRSPGSASVCLILPEWGTLAAPVEATARPVVSIEPKAVKGSFTFARRIALVMILGLASGAALQLQSDHRSAIQAAEAQTGAMVNSIEQHVGASIRSIDSLISEVVLTVELGRHHTPEFTHRMLARLRNFPEVRLVAVLGDGGRLVPGQWPEDAEARLDEALFDLPRHRQMPVSAAAAVGKPVTGWRKGERIIPLTRAVRDRDGRIVGVVLASINPDIYAHFLDQLLLDEQGASAVIGLDGRMMARAPAHAEKFGIDISDSDLFVLWLPRAASGIAPLISKADGNDKFVGYKVVRGYPLVVTSAISRAKALQEWYGQARIEMTAVAAVSLILFLWAWESDRQSRRLHKRVAQSARIVEERTADLTLANRIATERAIGLTRVNEALRHLSLLATRQLDAPARAIASRSQALAERLTGVGDDAEAMLEFIHSASLHLTALIRDFQRYSTVCSNSPNATVLPAAAVAEKAAHLVLSAVGTDSARIEIAELPLVRADEGMLLEVFLQLFSNAVRHRGHRPLVSITVRAFEENGACVLAVADDGPGITPDIRDRVLQVFETMHGRSPDSTGLGLPLCRIIVQAHGGRIWLDSSDHGTVVYFTLPHAPAS